MVNKVSDKSRFYDIVGQQQKQRRIEIEPTIKTLYLVNFDMFNIFYLRNFDI